MLWEQNDVLREQDNIMLWEQNSRLWGHHFQENELNSKDNTTMVA
jgi:hypothetical protein